MATLCEKCLHKEVCAIRDSQEEGEEQALKFCSEFKMESVIAMKVITEIESLFAVEKFRLICNRQDFAKLKKKYTEE